MRTLAFLTSFYDLNGTLDIRKDFFKKLSKNFMQEYTLDPTSCPNIGISLKKKINKKKVSKNTLFYIPRKKPGYDTIFFFGMIKFNKSQIKKQLKKQIINNLIN
jgi:hypothetical protein